MADRPRLIDHAFPLKQASLDSVHEKSVRHGHISTLHIWPARRPLAACRAAIIAALLSDPGTPEERQKLCEKIGGKVIKKIERKMMPNGQIVEREKEMTEGGILHWGRETQNKEDLEWFRQEIRKAYGGRAPKVLDPFAGGGAIPLEAMRLGCEATAVDINPVAWFILKCTLEYPQKMAGQKSPLPEFILLNHDFMESFFKAQGIDKPSINKEIERLGLKVDGVNLVLNLGSADIRADLAWHVRAWGQRVLDHARRELAQFYPTYADFEHLPLTNKDKKDVIVQQPFEKQPMQLVPLKEDGTPDLETLNADLSAEYLAGRRNPRWVAKPTVAYLWARTVKCKNCRATIPLLKTLWLCKKKDGKKRVLLTMRPNEEKTGVLFVIEGDVPVNGGNPAQRREHDKRIGAGTMSKSGARCPCCRTIMVMEDIRLEGQAGRLGVTNTAVVVDGQNGKEYRLPTRHEIQMAEHSVKIIPEIYKEIPFGLPSESLPSKETLGFRVPLYGFDQWSKLFAPRQLLALGTFLKWTRAVGKELPGQGHSSEWTEAVVAYLACMFDRLSNQSSNVSRWNQGGEKIEGTFARFALPILWDFAEVNPLGETSGGYPSAFGWVTRACDHLTVAANGKPAPSVVRKSALNLMEEDYDCVVTDPPYYDAIPYSDLMDFFYIWLRRMFQDLSQEFETTFEEPLGPKWNQQRKDGELIDDATRHDGDKAMSKAIYEDGMARVFERCGNALKPDGKMIVVFANKQPAAWETLVSALVRSGFVVDGSWPIQTEMGTRTRALSSAALASSVWLVCKKRPAGARPGWDNKVLDDMRRNIRTKLRDFWDAGIRGPDFVWAATGPALEAYSRHPVVKKANEPGPMTVPEFLTHVRRIVVEFVVGRVMQVGESTSLRGDDDSKEGGCTSLDEPTAYYLLHRHDYGLEEAPVGTCILYAVSCGLSDRELSGTWNIIGFTKGKSGEEDEDEESEADDDSEDDSGSKVKLRTWAQRTGRSLGYEAPQGKPVPLIDRVHRLMHLWKAGDLKKVDEYLDSNGLRRQELFKRLLQSIIELSPHTSEERSLLESISNHIQARGPVMHDRQTLLLMTEDSEESTHG